MPTDLSSSTASNAQGPAEARGDSGSVRQHRLRDLIDADRYLAAKDALAHSWDSFEDIEVSLRWMDRAGIGA